ncbi:hypothethical protein (plasmid) [Ralstonia solanacearum PSI07]|nr:hypothethical protein [Ralstonia solanacearum PSI07]
MPARLEKLMPLNRKPSVTVVRPTTFYRDQLTLDQRFYICAIQLAGFGVVADQEQNGKFMRAQHSRLRLVSFGCHVTIARDGGSAS